MGENQRDIGGDSARSFEAYTAADHARVVMAEAAWSTLEAAYRAVVPEAHHDGADPRVLIESARWVAGLAETLLSAAVVASHEQGQSWTQIGRALETSKQAAHERFAEDVTDFRTQLARHLDKLATDPDATPQPQRSFSGFGMLLDTAWYAPKLDAWRAELGEIPGLMTKSGAPGELLARLSDPATAVTGVNGTKARPPDATAPQCRFTADPQWHEDAEPGEYLTCTLPEGHPGRHQPAIGNIHD